MRYFFTLLILTSASLLLSQQEAQFSQYYNNAYFFNPAAGGLTKTMQFDLGYRRQWLGIEGIPQSFYATGHSQVSFNKRKKVIDEFNVDKESVFKDPKNAIGKNKHVLGGRMLSDQIGPFLKNSVMASYAYHLRFSSASMLSLGVSAGWSNLGLNSSKVVLHEQADSEYDEFLSNNSNQNIFDINAGIAYYGKNFHFGISSTQLLKNDLVVNKIVTQSQFGRHWFGYGMYLIDMSGDVDLEPHFMAQFIGNSPFSFNVGSRVIYDDRYWVNVAYRIGDAINFGVGLNFANNFRFGYAYDVAAGPVQRTSNYVHELQIGMVLGNNRNVKKELNNEEKL
ncbi:MAG: type IX secretion system membrane protein PorP/SprF [Brumimicrobium sp.]